MTQFADFLPDGFFVGARLFERNGQLFLPTARFFFRRSLNHLQYENKDEIVDDVNYFFVFLNLISFDDTLSS